MRSYRVLCTTVASVVALVALLPSCGGGATPFASELTVLEVGFVDATDASVVAAGSQNVARNVRLRIVFSKPVLPSTVTPQSVRVRFGPDFSTEVQGSLQVDGAIVRFDPTLRADGTSNPFGLAPFLPHRLVIKDVAQDTAVVRSFDGDPLVLGHEMEFLTNGSYLGESQPPSVLGVRFLPEPDPLTGNVSSDALLAIDFDEPMDPNSFVLSRDTLTPRATLDVRYSSAPINATGGVDGRVVSGRLTWSRDARTYFFRPFFSFGTQKFIFDVRVFNDLRDLAGNRLLNPRSFGSFTCDGTGTAVGTVLEEDFFDAPDRDGLATDADWGSTEIGACHGTPITTRTAYISSYTFADQTNDSGRGQYVPDFNPLLGVTINQVQPNLMPPSALGRRVMWSFSDVELGAAGTITGLAWGPDSNATFAADYQDIRIQVGYKRTSTLQLETSFSSNFRETPTELFRGNYTVAQAADIGNTPGLPTIAHKPGYASANFAPCNQALNWNLPLFTATGFLPWPTLQRTFDWVPGDLGIDNDEALVLDIQVPEGTNYQTGRSWFGVTMPCSGIPIAGFPQRRMFSVVDQDTPNPPPAVGGPNPILNPDPTVSDTAFTIVRHKSTAQSLFYAPKGDPLVATGGATFGTDSDYQPALLTPQSQPFGADVTIEYQGATAIDPDRRTIQVAQPFTAWTTNVDDCDGMPYIRWRLRFVGNLLTEDPGRVTRVQIPVRDASGGP